MVDNSLLTTLSFTQTRSLHNQTLPADLGDSDTAICYDRCASDVMIPEPGVAPETAVANKFSGTAQYIGGRILLTENDSYKKLLK